MGYSSDNKTKDETKVEFDRNQNIDTINQELDRFRQDNGAKEIDAKSIGIGDGNVFEESDKEETEEPQPQNYEQISQRPDPPLSSVRGMECSAVFHTI